MNHGGTEPFLEVEGLDVWLGPDHRHVVRDFELQLGRAEILGVVGESGAGKTQAAAGIIGLAGTGQEVRSSGTVRFRGESFDAADLKALAGLRGRGISMLTQESMASLTPVRKVGALLLETLDQVGKGGGYPRASALLAEVGFERPERVLDSFAHQLSGGMRQRVAFALALASDPELLITDEPTTALDLRLQAELMGLISRLRRERQMSILLITHDLAVVAQLADSMLLMRDGRVVERGSTEQVFAQPSDPYTRELLKRNRDRRSGFAAA